jgi:hypothetical protein
MMTGHQNPDAFFRTVGKILFWFFLVFTIICSCLVYCTRSGFVLQIGLLLFAVIPAGGVTGFLFIRYYLPGIAENIGFGLIFPRQYLKKAPPVLSPFHALLSSEKYEEGYRQTAPLLQQYPDDPDLVYLFAEFCFGSGRDPVEGFAAMEQLFQRKRRVKSNRNRELLFYYADQSVRFQHTEHLCEVLRRELRTGFYTDAEKNAIECRLKTLERGLK